MGKYKRLCLIFEDMNTATHFIKSRSNFYAGAADAMIGDEKSLQDLLNGEQRRGNISLSKTFER